MLFSDFRETFITAITWKTCDQQSPLMKAMVKVTQIILTLFRMGIFGVVHGWGKGGGGAKMPPP